MEISIAVAKGEDKVLDIGFKVAGTACMGYLILIKSGLLKWQKNKCKTG